MINLQLKKNFQQHNTTNFGVRLLAEICPLCFFLSRLILKYLKQKLVFLFL